jgi:hypothetical protein
MERGNINAYIAKFEQVVRQAGLDIDRPLVVNKFARGLPKAMYDFIYTHKKPQTYDQWQHEAFNSQKTFVHLRNCIDEFKGNTPRQQGNWRGVVQANRDPNAMDTSPGRTCVTVSPSPQPTNTTNRSIVALQEYARDFRCQHTTDTDTYDYNSDDEDRNLAIRHLVVT